MASHRYFPRTQIYDPLDRDHGSQGTGQKSLSSTKERSRRVAKRKQARTARKKNRR